MPLFVSALLGGLLNIAGTIAGRVLIGLGIGVVTYTGLNTMIGFLEDAARSSFQSLGVDVVGMLALMRVGSCISMVFSAISIRMTINGLTGDTMKAWVKK